jgi:hypothetical protein
MNEEYQLALTNYSRYLAVAEKEKIESFMVNEHVQTCEKVLEKSDN